MKKLFFVLLVLNLVLWLWGKRQELAPGLVPVEPGVGVIRLLDESEVAARHEQAAEPALGQTAIAAPSAATEPASPPDEPAGDPVLRHIVADAKQVASAADALPAPNASDVGTVPAASAVAVDTATAELQTPSAVRAPEAAAAPAETMPETAPVAGPGDVSTRPLIAEPPAESDANTLASPPDSAPRMAPGGPEALAVDEMPAASTPTAVTAPAEPAVVTSAQAEAGGEGEISALAMVAVSPMPAPMLCESVGPFRDRAAAERYASSLRVPVLGVAVREEVTTKPARYWVLAPAAQGGDTVYREALAAAGIQDAWRVNSGPFAGRLSLGAFQVEDNARKQVAMLAARGIASELQQVKEPERRWWIDYERPDGVPVPAKTLGTARVVERRCARVAAP